MERSSPDLLSGLLRNVSRSFYLTLRVLPRGVRRQIGLAYLLARASDTIADTDAIPPDQRLAVLRAFAARTQGDATRTLELGGFVGYQSSRAETALLLRVEEAFALLSQFGAEDQRWIRQVLATITSGQSLDVERFAQADEAHVSALACASELDDYTYRVAGCVGEFWTRICRAHLFPKARLDEERLLDEAVQFGKGLQLVNILRDLPRDLRLGRCYLPTDRLREVGLTPADLLDPGREEQLRPVYLESVERAERFLQAGWDYTDRLPFGQVRVRLACAWPVLIGVRTLARLRSEPFLDPARRIKITRREVRAIMGQSIWCYPRRSAWRRLLEHARRI